MAKARLMPGYEKYWFMFVSKAPYTDAALQLAKRNANLSLVTLDMLFM